MVKPIRKELKVGVAPEPSEKEKEPQPLKKEVKKKVSKGKLPLWNFPLKQRSVRAKNLQEAIKKVNTKE